MRKATREREGSVYKRLESRPGRKGKPVDVWQWYARRRYTDPVTGAWREKKRRARSQADAIALRKVIDAEILAELSGPPPEAWTFARLADWYAAEYLQPPRFVGDVKVAGLSSYRKQRSLLRPLRAAFGDQSVAQIEYGDLKRYKAARLATPVKTAHRSKPRTIVSVHRELALLRAMLNKAAAQGWVARNPFAGGDTLISLAEETERMRVLTRAEESALLAQCVGGRVQLRAAIVCAIDTGLRLNEQFSLAWGDVDLERGFIQVRARNAKTRKRRTVPITSRLYDEFEQLRRHSRGRPEDPVFAHQMRTAFRTARARAGLADLHWHDLRHTAITWMLDAGIPEAKVMKISGHTAYKTFLKYVGISEELAREAAQKMDARRARTAKEPAKLRVVTRDDRRGP